MTAPWSSGSSPARSPVSPRSRSLRFVASAAVPRCARPAAHPERGAGRGGARRARSRAQRAPAGRGRRAWVEELRVWLGLLGDFRPRSDAARELALRIPAESLAPATVESTLGPRPGVSRAGIRRARRWPTRWSASCSVASRPRPSSRTPAFWQRACRSPATASRGTRVRTGSTTCSHSEAFQRAATMRRLRRFLPQGDANRAIEEALLSISEGSGSWRAFLQKVLGAPSYLNRTRLRRKGQVTLLRGLFLDLIERMPTDREMAALVTALRRMPSPTAAYAVIAKVLVDSGTVPMPLLVHIKDAPAWDQGPVPAVPGSASHTEGAEGVRRGVAATPAGGRSSSCSAWSPHRSTRADDQASTIRRLGPSGVRRHAPGLAKPASKPEHVVLVVLGGGVRVSDLSDKSLMPNTAALVKQGRLVPNVIADATDGVSAVARLLTGTTDPGPELATARATQPTVCEYVRAGRQLPAEQVWYVAFDESAAQREAHSSHTELRAGRRTARRVRDGADRRAAQDLPAGAGTSGAACRRCVRRPGRAAQAERHRGRAADAAGRARGAARVSIASSARSLAELDRKASLVRGPNPADERAWRAAATAIRIHRPGADRHPAGGRRRSQTPIPPGTGPSCAPTTGPWRAYARPWKPIRSCAARRSSCWFPTAVAWRSMGGWSPARGRSRWCCTVPAPSGGVRRAVGGSRMCVRPSVRCWGWRRRKPKACRGCAEAVGGASAASDLGGSAPQERLRATQRRDSQGGASVASGLGAKPPATTWTYQTRYGRRLRGARKQENRAPSDNTDVPTRLRASAPGCTQAGEPCPQQQHGRTRRATGVGSGVHASSMLGLVSPIRSAAQERNGSYGSNGQAQGSS